MTRLPLLTLVPVFVLVFACTDPVDKAAKERIFSPEDPPKAVASASETLEVAALDEDPRLARRVLTMGAAETTERLGPHRLDAQLQFTWSAGKAGNTQLTEKRTLLSGRGGVGGDFHATIENSRDQGLEVMRVEGKVFAKNRYQKFRQRLRDRGMAERAREDIAGVLRDVDTLFAQRVQLVDRGTVTHAGRPAHRYGLQLADAPAPGVTKALPPPPEPKTGQDPATLRRKAFFEKREPIALNGLIVVDDETGTILWAKVDGRLRVPDEAGTSELDLDVDLALSEIGKPLVISAPKDFLPDADKPQGIADALDRFGIPRGGQEKADAGTAAPVEPEDEEAP